MRWVGGRPQGLGGGRACCVGEPTPQFKGEAGGSPRRNEEETSGVVGGALAERRKAGWVPPRPEGPLPAGYPAAALLCGLCPPAGPGGRGARCPKQRPCPARALSQPLCSWPAAQPARLPPVAHPRTALCPAGRAGWWEAPRVEGPSRGPLVSCLLCNVDGGSCFSQASTASGLLSPGRTADPPVTGELWGLGSGARGAARAPTPSPTPQPHEHQAPARGPQRRAFPKPALLWGSWWAGAGGWRK